MQHHHLTALKRRHLLLGASASAVLALAGCGGGGGDVAGVGSGGTGSFASGPIQGFGSIVVGQVHFDEAGAAITSEAGTPLAASALRLGMVAEVEGSAIRTDAASGQRRATASRIQLRSEIEGPVSAIDRAAGTLTVLGQLVHVGPATVFEDTLRGGLASLAVGQVVEIHGLLRSPGQYSATRIEREDDADDDYKLRGVVSDLDRQAQTLRIGQALISYATLTGLSADLANGQYVRLELATQPDASGRWRATRLQAYRAGTQLPASGSAEVELEGFVTAFTSSRRFAVNGVAVDAGGVAQLPAGLALGSRVEVKGVLQSGMLVAREVELEDDADGGGFEVEGRITSINPGAQTLQLHGVSVYYAGARFKGGTAAQLAVGVKVEVKGPLAADGSTIVAQEIEFDD